LSGLRLDIDLAKIGDNARVLVDRAAESGVTITAVTKALLGDPQLARVLVAAGVDGLGDSRIENIERMRHAYVKAPMLLIRSAMPSQVDRIVRSDVTSINTEFEVLTALATAARRCGRVHDVMVMVELGDLRDGVMPADLHGVVRHIMRLPTLRLTGIAANLACRSGTAPTDANMGRLSRLVDTVESTFGIAIRIVSGGNSANVGWLATTSKLGRINNLRLGESILLGRNPLDRSAIAGLHTDAVTLSAEVIESRRKPTRSWGVAGQNAFGAASAGGASQHEVGPAIWQTIVAAGRQDIDPDDLRSPAGVTVLAASSDHLVVGTDARVVPGDEIRFEPGYSAVLRAMTSPFVEKVVRERQGDRPIVAVSSRRPRPASAPSPSDRTPNLTVVPRPTPEARRRARLEM
jgi:ornithine racemase